MSDVIALHEHKHRRPGVALHCYLHDPAVPESEKAQTLCHCWDHLDIRGGDE